jgi:hypothetical protein
MHSVGRVAVLIAAAAGFSAFVPAAAAGTSGHWTQITHAHSGAKSNLGLARGADGTLHVLWAGPARAPFTAILDTPISKNAAVGKPQPVVSGWSSVLPPAAVTVPDGSIHAVVSGQKVNSNTDPNSGLNEVVGPRAWKVGAHAFGSSSITEASNADVRTAVLKSGQLISVWRSAASMLFQTGVDSSTQPHDITPQHDPGIDPVVAVDQQTGDAIIAYSGVSSGSVFFRRILPTLDAPRTMPQAKEGGPTVAARSGGGVFTAYTPDESKVWLLEFGGQPKAVPVPYGARVLTTAVAAGPAGRLWIFYGNEQTTYVTRTSKAVSSCFEPVQRLTSPPHAVQYFQLEGEGSAGPLDLFADVTVDGATRDGSYYRQVRPRLSLSVAKTPVKDKHGKVKAVRVTVRVSDACDGVSGSTVSGLPGGSRTTKGAGSIIFTTSKRGVFALTARKAGYIGAQRKLSL